MSGDTHLITQRQLPPPAYGPGQLFELKVLGKTHLITRGHSLPPANGPGQLVQQ